MGDIAVIAAALLLLVFSLDSLAKIKQSEEKEEGILKIYLGFLILASISVIPYKLWQLAGSHHTPDGMLLTAGSALAVVVFIGRFYSRRVKSHSHA